MSIKQTGFLLKIFVFLVRGYFKNHGKVSREAWLLCGDFNEILKPEEKLGGPIREPWSLVDFNQMVNICRLKDLPYSGNNMTW